MDGGSLSFTDSRQGTARFAAKMQLETERDFVRSLLYHSVADRARPTDCHELDTLRHEIIKLEQAIKAKPSLEALLANTLAEKRAKFQAVGSLPSAGQLAGSPEQAAYQ